MRSPSFVVIAIAASLTACDVPAELAVPVSDPGGASYDERVIGKWYTLEPNDDAVALLTVQAVENGELGASFGYMAVSPGASGGAGMFWVHRTAYPSVIDGKVYYNSRAVEGGMVVKDAGASIETQLAPFSPPHPELGYWIISVEFEADDRMILGVLSDRIPSTRDLPRRKVDCGDDCDFERVEITSEDLIALIRSEPPEELFSIRIPFVRVGSELPPGKD